jgi:hypothetical protein
VTPPAPDAHAAPGRVRVFGEVLATDLPLPGLPVAARGDGQFAYWDLQTRVNSLGAGTHSAAASICGTLPYGNGVPVTLADVDGGAEIVFGDTGRFTLDRDARRIEHLAPPEVDRSAVALDLIGVVLPFALHQRGAWCLHASAVQTRDGVIAFLAPRGTGKSTLAAACVQHGCALVADDVLVLRAQGSGVVVTPSGLPMRLRADTAHALGVDDVGQETWGKVRVHSAMASMNLSLAACYVLAPVDADAAVSRVSRDVRAAALALLTNGKIAAMLGAGAAGDALSRCIEFASRAPVYDLAVPRALSRLDAVIAQLLAWHAGSADPTPHAA